MVNALKRVCLMRQETQKIHCQFQRFWKKISVWCRLQNIHKSRLSPCWLLARICHRPLLWIPSGWHCIIFKRPSRSKQPAVHLLTSLDRTQDFGGNFSRNRSKISVVSSKACTLTVPAVMLDSAEGIKSQTCLKYANNMSDLLHVTNVGTWISGN